jgi:hypothetical protein
MKAAYLAILAGLGCCGGKGLPSSTRPNTSLVAAAPSLAAIGRVASPMTRDSSLPPTIRETDPSEPVEPDPTLLAYHPVLLYEWPVWRSPTEFRGEIWLISGLHNVIQNSEPLARHRDGKWWLHWQPLRSPDQLAADRAGMLVAGGNEVAVRRVGETWKMIAAPVAMPARRAGVPGIAYSSGDFIRATLDDQAWRWNWQTANWEPTKLDSSKGRPLKVTVQRRNPGLTFVGNSGHVFWSDCSARGLKEPLREMHDEPRYTLFVRQPNQLYVARDDGTLTAIPYMPFVEWLRNDEYIGSPVGPLQIDSDGVLYQIVDGPMDSRPTIVRFLPKVGVYRPIGNLPGPAESFWLRGAPHWRVGREVYSLDGKRRVTVLPAEFDQVAKLRKVQGGYVPLVFSRTETVAVLDRGIARYDGESWVDLTWKQLGIRWVEVEFVAAAVDVHLPKVLVPEFTPSHAVDGLLFMRQYHAPLPMNAGEAHVLDLNHWDQGITRRTIARVPAPRRLMPNTAGFVRGGWRKIFFLDRDTVYEAADTWEAYWQGFVGFTPYFRARGHVFLADLE